MTKFADLGLSESTLEALSHLGYTNPTPIQEQAIPPLLEGKDVIGQAQTGTGKTAAFGLPMVEYADPSDPAVQALVLTPTRELCIQVTQALRAYGAQQESERRRDLRRRPDPRPGGALKDSQIVVGTVGRVMDMIGRHHLFLDDVRYVILDEADEMLDLGFLEDVESILRRAADGAPDGPLQRHGAARDPPARRHVHARPGRDQGPRGHAHDRHGRPFLRRGRRTARSPTRSCAC